MNKGIPSKFVWTRMNTDAGEPLENIVRRKDLERQAGEGKFADTFWWGVGENKGPAVSFHLSDCEPEVLFSKGKGKPSHRDKYPDGRFIWTTYRIYEPQTSKKVDRRSLNRQYSGKCYPLPDNVIIQSGSKKKVNYYALVCRSRRPLELSRGEVLSATELRNLKKDGNRGKTLEKSPQTTCVVEYSKDAGEIEKPYHVNFRADLVCHCFVKLGGRKRLSEPECRLLDKLELDKLENEHTAISKYLNVAREIRG